MAPRVESRSSGGVSGGSDTGTSIWLQSVNLDVYGSSNGYIVANIVFIGIWMLALFVIAIWSMGLDRRSEVGHAVLGWKEYGDSDHTDADLRFYAFTFAQSIIQANYGSIANVYFIFANILADLQYPATTWLLLAIYSLLFHFCITPDQSKRARHRGYFRAHVVLCILTIGLWIAILVFNITNTAMAVDGDGIGSTDYYTTWTAVVGFDLDGAFQAILMAASIEIIIFALWLPVRARRYSKEYYTASSYFFRLVAIPFFILRVLNLAYAAAFDLSGQVVESWGAYIAFTLFTGGCTVFIFVGLVIVTQRLEQVQLWPQVGNQVVGQPPFAYLPAPTVQSAPIFQTNPHCSYGPVSPILGSQTYSQELHGQGQGVQEMPTALSHHEKP